MEKTSAMAALKGLRDGVYGAARPAHWEGRGYVSVTEFGSLIACTKENGEWVPAPSLLDFDVGDFFEEWEVCK